MFGHIGWYVVFIKLDYLFFFFIVFGFILHLLSRKAKKVSHTRGCARNSTQRSKHLCKVQDGRLLFMET